MEIVSVSAWLINGYRVGDLKRDIVTSKLFWPKYQPNRACTRSNIPRTNAKIKPDTDGNNICHHPKKSFRKSRNQNQPKWMINLCVRQIYVPPHQHLAFAKSSALNSLHVHNFRNKVISVNWSHLANQNYDNDESNYFNLVSYKNFPVLARKADGVVTSKNISLRIPLMLPFFPIHLNFLQSLWSVCVCVCCAKREVHFMHY